MKQHEFCENVAGETPEEKEARRKRINDGEGIVTIDRLMNQAVDWVWRKSEYGPVYYAKPLAISEMFLTFAEDNRGGASFCLWMASLGAKVASQEIPFTSTLVVSTKGCLLIGEWKDDEFNEVSAADLAVGSGMAMFAFHYRPGVKIHDRFFESYERPQWSIVMSCDGATVYKDWVLETLDDTERLKCHKEALRVIKLVDVAPQLQADLQSRIDALELQL
jgi:hypothetical protein